ncbi:Ig-like domain-containing protein, partial [Planctomycetota bacterium]
KGTGLDVSVVELLRNDRIHGAFGGDMAVELVGTASHGHVEVTADNRLHYRPDQDFVGADRVYYRITNANGVSDPVAIDFNVTEADPIPVASDDSFEIAQRGGLNISVEDLLANGEHLDEFLDDGLSIEIIAGPEHGRATVTPDNRLHYSPARTFSGTDQIEFRLVSEQGASETASIEVVVNADVELAPKSIGSQAIDSFGIKQGSGLNIAASALLHGTQNTGHASAQSLEITSSPEHGVAVITPDGRLHYSPSADFMGRDRISFQIDNGDGTFGAKTIELVVYPRVEAVTVVESGEGRFAARREVPRPISDDGQSVAFELASRRSGSEPLLGGTSAEGSSDRFESGQEDDESESELAQLLNPLGSGGPSDWAAKLAGIIAS